MCDVFIQSLRPMFEVIGIIVFIAGIAGMLHGSVTLIKMAVKDYRKK